MTKVATKYILGLESAEIIPYDISCIIFDYEYPRRSRWNIMEKYTPLLPITKKTFYLYYSWLFYMNALNYIEEEVISPCISTHVTKKSLNKRFVKHLNHLEKISAF